MLTIVPYEDAQPSPVHSDHIDQMIPGAIAPELIADICQNPRFQDRLAHWFVQEIFDHTDDVLPITEVEAETLSQLMGSQQDMLFRHLGIAWFGPKIASDLMTPTGRSNAGDLTDDECLIALSHRLHCDVAVVKGTPGLAEYLSQGMYCFVAWLWQFDRSIRDRVLLTLPATVQFPMESLDARTALFERMLGTANLVEGQMV